MTGSVVLSDTAASLLDLVWHDLARITLLVGIGVAIGEPGVTGDDVSMRSRRKLSVNRGDIESGAGLFSLIVLFVFSENVPCTRTL